MNSLPGHLAMINDSGQAPAEKPLSAPGPGSPVGGVAPQQSQRVHIGMKLNSWAIISRIGAGSFGEAFSAIEVSDIPNYPLLEAPTTPEAIEAWLNGLPPPQERKEVCVKVEQENKNVLRLEALALKRVQSCSQVVRYLGSGCTGGMNFLVMEKLGPNLADLRRKSPHGTFNMYTTLKAGISCLQAIREVHERGLIHRDIKPSNFITGIPGTPEHSICYLIDFGLARRYRRSSGELREAREHAGFRGTSRYASVASHRHTELGRVDDLWSLLFMLIEFATGTLPWRKFRVKEDIGRCKERSIGPRLVRNLPREFQLFLSHLESLKYEDEPDYELLLSCLHRAVERRGYPPDKLLDWQLDPDEQEGSGDEHREAKAAEDEAGDKQSLEPQPEPPAAAPSSPRPPDIHPERVQSALRVSEVDVSCPQTGRVEEGHGGAPSNPGLLAGLDSTSPLQDVLETDGEVKAAPTEEQDFSPREAVRPHHSHSRVKPSTKPPPPAADLTDDAVLNEGVRPAKPYDNGTTSMNLPPPPPAPSPQEKEKSKCKCLVM